MTPSLSLRRKNHYVNAPLCLLFIVDLRRSSIWPHYFISCLISQTKSNEIVTTNMLFWGTHYMIFFCKAQLFYRRGMRQRDLHKIGFSCCQLSFFIFLLCVEILREIWVNVLHTHLVLDSVTKIIFLAGIQISDEHIVYISDLQNNFYGHHGLKTKDTSVKLKSHWSTKICMSSSWKMSKRIILLSGKKNTKKIILKESHNTFVKKILPLFLVIWLVTSTLISYHIFEKCETFPHNYRSHCCRCLSIYVS